MTSLITMTEPAGGKSDEQASPRKLRTIGQLLLSLTVGGGEVLAARMARQMRDRYRFVFFCLDGLGTLGERLRAEGFPVHLLGRRAGLDWRCARRLARLAQDENVDLLHAHQYSPFFYAALARLFHHNIPIVFTEHGRFFPDYRRRKRVLANRLLLRRRNRVVGVGQAVRQALIVNEGLPSRRVEVIYNGIDLTPYAGSREEESGARRGGGETRGRGDAEGGDDGQVTTNHTNHTKEEEKLTQGRKDAKKEGERRKEKGGPVLEVRSQESGVRSQKLGDKAASPLTPHPSPLSTHPSPLTIAALRDEFGFACGDFLIIHVARLDEIKDHATAIRAFAQIHARRGDARLLIVGEGPARTAIEAEVAKHDLQPFARLAGVRHDVPRLLAQADVLWLTSVSEGIPLTLIEGMAAGLPVVATDVGGVSEVVQEGTTGLLAPAGDSAALAECVLRLAGDPELRRRLGAAGRTRAFDHFSESAMHASYARIYDEALGQATGVR